MAWKAGQHLHSGKYTVDHVLGRGRLAITYRVKDPQEKFWVVKAVDEGLFNGLDDEGRNKLEANICNEAIKLERCKHPNVVQVKEYFKEGSIPCLAMEYIQGDTLETLKQRILPEKEALHYIRQIAAALEIVHDQGLLHRDVKPSNIMLRGGTHEAVLIDFDLMRDFEHPITSIQEKIEPGFAPIELYSSTFKCGPWTDVYALAATLYVLLTGELPESADKRHDATSAIQLTPPTTYNPRISSRTNEAILAGMKLLPSDRPASVREWVNQFGFSLSRGPNLKFSWKSPLLWAILAVVATVIIGIIGAIPDWWILFNRNQAPPEAPPASQTDAP